MAQDAVARFWAKVDQCDRDECWEWTGAVRGPGYGAFKVNCRDTYVHRFSYELANGPIPAGLQIDHLCRNRICVNPAHLEAVTMRENILRGMGWGAVDARKTHCPRGHELPPRGHESRGRCVTCIRAYHRAYNRGPRRGRPSRYLSTATQRRLVVLEAVARAARPIAEDQVFQSESLTDLRDALDALDFSERAA